MMQVKEKSEQVSEFAKRVSTFRTASGVSQEKLAGMLGISRNYVSMIEGGRTPSDSVVKLFETLEASPLYKGAQGGSPQNPIARARANAGLSIIELHEQTGYSIGVLQAVEEGRSPVSEKMADALVSALPTLDREALLRNDEHPPTLGVEIAAFGTKPDIRTAPGVKTRYVPLISWAQAGQMKDFNDIYDHEGHISFDAKDAKAFAVTLRGDSMEPRFTAGDVAIVYPQHEARNGELIIAKTRDGDVFFKRLTIISPNQYRFSSYNPAYPPFDRKRSEMEWLYKVASVTIHNL